MFDDAFDVVGATELLLEWDVDVFFADLVALVLFVDLLELFVEGLVLAVVTVDVGVAIEVTGVAVFEDWINFDCATAILGEAATEVTVCLLFGWVVVLVTGNCGIVACFPVEAALFVDLAAVFLIIGLLLVIMGGLVSCVVVLTFKDWEVVTFDGVWREATELIWDFLRALLSLLTCLNSGSAY